MEQLRDIIEELLKFTLHSHINQTLEIDLPLSKEFCSILLTDDPDYNVSSLPPTINTSSFQGIPQYPLFKRLALALHHSIISGSFCKTYERIEFIEEDIRFKQKEEQWNKLIVKKGSELMNVSRDKRMLNAEFYELHVQEPFFSQIKDGLKTVEGRCASDKYSRIEPGAMVLFNKSLVFEVENVRRYASFSEMLRAESLSEVLPGVKTIEEGVKIYRNFYTEEKEMSNGVLAICLAKFPPQPYLYLANILSELSYDGVQSLLGLAHTAGTVSDALPPPRSALLSSFTIPYRPNVKATCLTHGARALAKHAERGSDKYWGILSGSDSTKNRLAMNVINRLIATYCWSNVHIVPQHGAVFEIRVADGYGARWSKDGTKFIGFLEPYMEDGHSREWKH